MISAPSLLLFRYSGLFTAYLWISYFFFNQSLLTDPNPNSPANAEAAKLFNDNRKEYTRRVLEIVELSWEAEGEEEEEEEETAA